MVSRMQKLDVSDDKAIRMTIESASGHARNFVPHAASAQACIKASKSDAQMGLSRLEAEARLEAHGPNEISSAQQSNIIQLMARQFSSGLILVLIGAAAVSASVGYIGDAATILAIVLVNAILGGVQEWRAANSLAALKKFLSPRAAVVREGVTQDIDAREIVEGDLIRLKTGDRVPADLRLIHPTGLTIEEAILTGESSATSKQTKPVASNAPLSERTNLAFMGTTVVAGHATGIATSTGMRTELGRIAALTEDLGDTKTPLEIKLQTLGKQLGIAAIAIAIGLTALGVLTGRPWFEMLMTGVSLAVAAVPEGLPAVITITLALGVMTMARKKALLRNLQAAEALGAVDVICTDKTGTLTRNEMLVTDVWLAAGALKVEGNGYAPSGNFIDSNDQPVLPSAREDLQALLHVAMSCNNAEVIEDPDGSWRKVGEATEAALMTLAQKGGLSTRQHLPAVEELPFSSARKRMTVVVENETGKATALVKGAPEVILERTTHVRIGKDIVAIDDDIRAQATQAFTAFANAGKRTLALASRNLDTGMPDDLEDVEQGLTLLGVVGILDAPRIEVAAALADARKAGIKVVMITGDAGETAAAIASQIGLAGTTVVTGPHLDTMTDAELRAAIASDAIFARVAPEHKVRIVEVLQALNQRIAMTGDGVNDAPALKRADVGIAMGIRGTDVARDASDIVLADDNFATIIAAIREGRRQYQNIVKFVCYLLSSNTAEVIAIGLAIIVGGPLIFLPVQILWMNLVTDGPTALALGTEPEDKTVMASPPRPSAEPILTRARLTLVASAAAYMSAATLVVFWLSQTKNPTDLAYAQTMAFTTMILLEKVNVLNFRRFQSDAGLGVTSLNQNRWLAIAIAGTIALQLLAIYAPPLQSALHTVPLNGSDWLIILAAAVPVLAVGQATKLWISSRN
ncbi:MAG: HAD-IC family P-type ATPase [Pseudomonadota bacterium]